jgi:hypothetical protein
MNLKALTTEARVRATTGAIIVVGFACAVLIFFANGDSGNVSAYRPEDSKKYLREMEVYGGKANVLASDLRSWFDSLWHGRTLAFTVAAIALLVALLYRFLTTPLPSGAASNSGQERNPPRPPESPRRSA